MIFMFQKIMPIAIFWFLKIIFAEIDVVSVLVFFRFGVNEKAAPADAAFVL